MKTTTTTTKKRGKQMKKTNKKLQYKLNSNIKINQLLKGEVVTASVFVRYACGKTNRQSLRSAVTKNMKAHNLGHKLILKIKKEMGL